MRALALVLFLAGCGSSHPKRDCMDCGAPMISPHETGCPTPESQKNSSLDLHCPEGLVPSCDAGLTTNQLCVAPDAVAGPDCTAKIALVCEEPAVDGCLDQSTTTHVCVTRGDWK